jgi:hypothetical protein
VGSNPLVIILVYSSQVPTQYYDTVQSFKSKTSKDNIRNDVVRKWTGNTAEIQIRIETLYQNGENHRIGIWP